MCWRKFLPKETLKALFWAILTVLLLRHFVVEPFKVPTPSMEPTIIGDPRCGDYVFVNKAVYYFRDPKRWDVIVFYHPLNEKFHVVKRLVGLPGEKLSLKNGNVYINDEIAVKPEAMDDVLKHLLFDSRKHKAKDFWKKGGGLWEETGDCLSVQAREASWMSFAPKILDTYKPLSDGFFTKRQKPLPEMGGSHVVGELDLCWEAETLLSQGDMLVRMRSGLYRFVLSLTATSGQKSTLSIYEGEGKAPREQRQSDFILLPGRKYTIRMKNFDEVLRISVNGTGVFTWDYRRPWNKAPSSTQESSVRLGAQEGHFRFSQIQLFRDIYYVDPNLFASAVSWNIPAGAYFVLGDNSPVSSDSRHWRKFQMVLKNGCRFEGDEDHPPRYQKDRYTFTDIHGVFHSIPEEQVKEGITTDIDSPFVQAQQIFGKAMIVFWPPPRMKIIR